MISIIRTSFMFCACLLCLCLGGNHHLLAGQRHVVPSNGLTTECKVSVTKHFDADSLLSYRRNQLLQKAREQAILDVIMRYRCFERDKVQPLLQKCPDVSTYILQETVISEDLSNVDAGLTARMTIDVPRLIGYVAVRVMAQYTVAPVVHVGVSEKIINLSAPDPAAEAGIINRCRAAGFTIRKTHNRPPQGAFSVSGEAFAEVRNGLVDQDIWSARARVEVSVKNDKGLVVYVISENASAADISPRIAGKQALEKAGQAAGERICGIILAESQRRLEVKHR